MNSNLDVAPVLPEVPRAYILAGGLGTRLRPALPDTPKALAPVAGRPFLFYLLRWLRRQGVRQATLCVGYGAERIRQAFGDGGALGLELDYSLEAEALGTGGALRQALAGRTGTALALNGDTLFECDLARLLDFHLAQGTIASLALARVPDGWARGCVELEAGGRVSAFLEKPASAAEALVSGGLYVLGPDIHAAWPEAARFSLEREVFPRLAAHGRLAGLHLDSYFVDIGTPETWREFERRTLERGIDDRAQ